MNDLTEPRFIFIFDLDGVLINTFNYHFRAWKEIMKKFGFEFTESFSEELKGLDRMQSLDKILNAAKLNFSESDKLKLATEKNNLFLNNIAAMNEKDILPGMENFIKEAIRIKIPLAVGSSSKNASILLEKTGLKKYFEVIVDGNMISKAKPDPEIYLSIAQKFNFPPKRCIVFEDSRSGVTAGKRAGMHVVGIGDHQYLDQADLVFKSLEHFRAHEIANWFSIQ
jgi:beta-phosphoglucomutase